MTQQQVENAVWHIMLAVLAADLELIDCSKRPSRLAKCSRALLVIPLTCCATMRANLAHRTFGRGAHNSALTVRAGMLRTLLNTDARIDTGQTTTGGNFALRAACLIGDADCVCQLLEYGSNVNQCTSRGTALSTAAQQVCKGGRCARVAAAYAI